MTQPASATPVGTTPGAAVHYVINASRSPGDAWQLVAAHHLLTSRHYPTATMSITGVDEPTARRLRIYATDLGLSGLRIPDPEPPAESVKMDIPIPTPPPSVTCEIIALSIEAASVSAIRATP